MVVKGSSCLSTWLGSEWGTEESDGCSEPRRRRGRGEVFGGGEELERGRESSPHGFRVLAEFAGQKPLSLSVIRLSSPKEWEGRNGLRGGCEA